MHKRTTLAVALGTGVALLVVAPAAPATAAEIDPSAFADTVTVEGITQHLDAFQSIADQNDGNRAAGTSGYEASAQYVESVLAGAGYTSERQYFSTASQTVNSASLTVPGVDLADAVPMEFTPSTDPVTGITGPVVAPADPLGCTTDAWAGVDATGAVAVISRGECAFSEKVAAAKQVGAIGAIIYNNEAGPLNGTLGGADDAAYVPAFGVTPEQGAAILATVGTGTATLAIDQFITTIETFNILAETPTGRDDNTVMLGAHLDSVPEGPGINDNGSGSAAILETAVQLAKAGDLNNQVRFAWWGAEEIGLVGSYYYTDDLAANNPDELDEIATYLNFDMVGSPNYVISIYDADESTFPAPVEVPAGAPETEDVFTDYFDSIGQPYIDTAFDGRSDYDGFISYGVPASGLFTGADDVKTEEEVALFGGTAGITHDPNYHQPGDDIDNINDEALGISAGAIAYATAFLANDTSSINGVGGPTGPSAEACEAIGDVVQAVKSPSFRMKALKAIGEAETLDELMAGLGITGDDVRGVLAYGDELSSCPGLTPSEAAAVDGIWQKIKSLQTDDESLSEAYSALRDKLVG
ncbi:M20/M25/M40 family metallo-hydrolase [Amnibacterium flavum]|uniref:Peptidase M28 n=1 Tax=Amnibacterium flavum TaxID=2173173 RepID=A0A2V1HUF3_9MICO|nr:M28 family peptidase [Amnibacterium flavum]PVZ93927.1 peptidase M28 [Amnibacterium flavum]